MGFYSHTRFRKKQKRTGGLFVLGTAIAALVFTSIYVGIRIPSNIHFNQQCGGYLKRAADATNIERAEHELGIAVDYLENRGMTEGYTSVVYQTPDEDIGFWYRNLKDAHNELKDTPKDIDPMTQSNVLIKLRETLIDHGSEGDTITVPKGISIYPHNTGVGIIGILAMSLWCLAIGGVIVDKDR